MTNGKNKVLPLSILASLFYIALFYGCETGNSGQMLQQISGVENETNGTISQSSETPDNSLSGEDTVMTGPNGLLLLPWETAQRIRKDYLDFLTKDWVNPDYKLKLEDIFIQEYFGIYNDSVAFFISVGGSMHLTVITFETVADVKFTYSSSQQIMVWNEGQFYGLTEAFNEGLLSKDNIESIADNYYWTRDWLR